VLHRHCRGTRERDQSIGCPTNVLSGNNGMRTDPKLLHRVSLQEQSETNGITEGSDAIDMELSRLLSRTSVVILQLPPPTPPSPDIRRETGKLCKLPNLIRNCSRSDCSGGTVSERNRCRCTTLVRLLRCPKRRYEVNLTFPQESVKMLKNRPRPLRHQSFPVHSRRSPAIYT
jgi:hypothetical protein